MHAYAPACMHEVCVRRVSPRDDPLLVAVPRPAPSPSASLSREATILMLTHPLHPLLPPPPLHLFKCICPPSPPHPPRQASTGKAHELAGSCRTTEADQGPRYGRAAAMVHRRGRIGGPSAAQRIRHLVPWLHERSESPITSGGLSLAAQHASVAAWTAE
jgi:hypothetical protein